ncbi:uncharacterized protein LOC121394646 isoform X2 [Xenopus laevis]|uniref:Uncharacterized protein LOC121394646 isoform X2 n=1 Tax=Xenopus laevis TaxID=8355 RepID=A0A8J1KZC3_XENLA|nr:uncharacterized protein LOC121394646 isoform X2 [Xenopus laevis]
MSHPSYILIAWPGQHNFLEAAPFDYLVLQKNKKMYRPRSGRHLRSSHYPYYRRYTYDTSDYFSKDDELFDMKRAKGPMQVCNIVCTSAYQLDEHLLGVKHKANVEENISRRSRKYFSRDRETGQDSALLVIQTNKELYQFLEYFEVASDSDVSFLLKVAKGFRCALQKFKSGNLENEVCQEVVPSSERSFSGDSEASTAMKTPMESESMSLEDLVPTCSDEEDT